jgi:predicted phage-related endonuclease
MSTITVVDEERAAFLAQRRTGLGGSDIAALFAGPYPTGTMHPFMSKMDLWRDKVGELPDEPPTAPQLRGRYLEPVAAELYEERTGRKVRRQPMRRHKDYPFLIGNVDRQILAGSGEGEHVAPSTATLEIKAPGLKVFWEIKRRGLREYMILQQQHYSLVFGYEWGAYAVLNAERWELLHFDIPAEPKVQQQIIDAAEEFWTKHVIPRIPPEEPPSPLAAEMEKLGPAGAVITRDDPEWAAAVRDLREAKEIKAEAEQVLEMAKQRLKALAGGYGVFEGAGARIYYRKMPGRRTFDRKALEAHGALDPVLVRELLREQPDVLDVLFQQAVLDLSKFEKQGKEYEEFHPFFLRAEE